MHQLSQYGTNATVLGGSFIGHLSESYTSFLRRC